MKLSAVQGPMQIKGRVDSVEQLPTDGVVVGSVYLVGLQDSTDFEEFVCTEVSPEVKYESVGKPNVPQVQSDWNQSDSESSDFVKNRPFYEDNSELVLSDTPVDGVMYFDWGEVVPVVGKSYSIEFDTDNDGNGILEHQTTIDTGQANTEFSPEGVVVGVSGVGSLYYTPTNFSAEGHNVNGKFSGNPNLRFLRLLDPAVQKIDAKFIDGYMVAGTGLNSNKFNSVGTNVASGGYSHAEGSYTTATNRSQHVFGENNIADPSLNGSNSRGNYVEIVGNGAYPNRSNARTLDWQGNENIAGMLRIGSSASTGGCLLKAEGTSLKISFNNGTTWLTVSAS